MREENAREIGRGREKKRKEKKIEASIKRGMDGGIRKRKKKGLGNKE